MSILMFDVFDAAVDCEKQNNLERSLNVGLSSAQTKALTS